MLSMPSVTMNDGMRKRAIRMPLASPARAPVSMPAAMPTGIGRPMFVMTTPVMTADRVMTVPIERSIPPVMITNVTPRARMPLTEVASRIPTALSNVRKFDDSSENTTIRTSSAPNASRRWTASERIRARGRARAVSIVDLMPRLPPRPRPAGWRGS